MHQNFYNLLFACVLWLIGNTLLAQTSEEKEAAAYVDAITSLQKKRALLFINANNLVMADQQLRSRIMQEDLNAASNAQVAAATPDLATRTTVLPSRDSESGSSKKRSQDNQQTVILTPVDNTGFKSAMATQAYFWQMQGMQDRGRLQQTHAAFYGVMVELNNNLANFCNLADIYGQRSRQESERAAEVCDTILNEDPSNVGAMLIRAASLRNLGQIEIAQRIASDAQKFPTITAPIAASLVAQCHILDGNYEAAHRQLAAAIKFSKGSTIENPLVIRALLHAAEGNFNKAIDDARKAVSSDKSATFALGVQALIECRREEKNQKLRLAVDHANQAVKASPDRSWALLEIQAVAEAASGDFDAAEKRMSEAIERTFGERRLRLERQLASFKENTLPPLEWKEYLRLTWAPFE